jgi:hypothetical protein
MVDGVIAERFADLRVEDIEGGDQDYGDGLFLSAFSDGAKDAVSVGVWHHHVEQDEVGRISVDDFEGFLPVAGLDERIGLRGEYIAENGTAIRVVIDD